MWQNAPFAPATLKSFRHPVKYLIHFWQRLRGGGGDQNFTMTPSDGGYAFITGTFPEKDHPRPPYEKFWTVPKRNWELNQVLYHFILILGGVGNWGFFKEYYLVVFFGGFCCFSRGCKSLFSGVFWFYVLPWLIWCWLDKEGGEISHIYLKASCYRHWIFLIIENIPLFTLARFFFLIWVFWITRLNLSVIVSH